MSKPKQASNVPSETVPETPASSASETLSVREEHQAFGQRVLERMKAGIIEDQARMEEMRKERMARAATKA